VRPVKGPGWTVGTNRRYADSVDRAINQRILDKVARAGDLHTLSRQELELDELPVTTDPKPAKVRAWVKFGATPILVDAEACMWTSHAVAIRFRGNDTEWRCWLWRGAVRETAP
jgi:hypothetical protein